MVLILEAVHMWMDFLKLSKVWNFGFWELELLIKDFGVKESYLLGSRPNTKGPEVYYYHYHESGAG